MLTTNTMRYGTDNFVFDHSGTIRPKESWDFTTASSVDGFTITGTQPTGTDRRAVFVVDGATYKLTVAGGEGTPTAVTASTTEEILENGNTMAELATVTSIPAWVGKTVTPVFALYADGDTEAENFPTLSMTAQYTIIEDKYDKTDESQEIELASDTVIITDITVNSETSDGNTVAVTVSLYNNGWGTYIPLTDALGQEASKVKFKAVSTVQTIGVGVCKLNSVKVSFRRKGQKISATDSVIITNTRDLGMAAKYIRTSLTHDRIKDAELKAYVTFKDGFQQRTLYSLGTATGNAQTFSLPDTGINPATLSIMVGSNKIYSYDYNLELGTITLTGEAGKEVFASYEYGGGVENWLEMEAVGTQVYESDKTKYNSSFSKSLPDSAVGKQIAAVKYELSQLPGTATENLGTATGKEQKFVLAHDAKEETLVIPGATFNLTDGILTLVAPAGTNLVATYDYRGVPITLYSYVVAWND